MDRFKQILNNQKPHLYAIFLCSVLLGLTIVAQVYLTVKVIYDVFLLEKTFHTVLPAIGFLLGAIVVRMVLIHLIGKISLKLGFKAKREIRNQLLNHFSTRSITPSNESQSGKQIGLMLDTVDEIGPYFSEYIPKLIQAVTIPLLLLIVIFTQNYPTGLIILFTAPFIPIFMAIIGQKTKDRSDEQLEQMNAFSAKFLDTLQGLKTLKLYGRAKQEEATIEKNTIGFRDATMKVLTVAFTSAFMMELISMLSMGLIALEVSFRLIIFDSITFQTAFLMLLLAPEFYVFLKDLSSAFHSGRESLTASKKINEELGAHANQVKWGNEPIGTVPPTIQLNEVSFRFQESPFELGPLSLTIEPYEKIALIGASGSGKTTLFHMIAGLMEPENGEILINEKERTQIAQQDWFSQLGYLSQDPYIFSGTIKENIALGQDVQPDDEVIWEVLRQVNLDALVARLPQGIHTPIGEAGRGLSGGEKQRLALARVLLKKPSILLFDEPTSGLDVKTEEMIQKTLKKLTGETTVITIAHRLQTIQNADHVWILDDGKMIASGSHLDLMATNTYYKELMSPDRKENF